MCPGKIQLGDRVLPIQNFYSTTLQGETPGLAAREIANTLFQLWFNPFQQPDIRSIQLDFEFWPESRLASIREVWTDSFRAAPGEEITLHLRLMNYRQEESIQSIQWRIPEDTPYGPLSLLAGNGDMMKQIKASVSRGTSSYAALLRRFEQAYSNDNLYILPIVDEPGLAQNGVLMPQLPVSVRGLLEGPSSSSQSMRLMRSPLQETVVPFDKALQGAQFTTLYITPQGEATN